jgi:hypothetical protein
MTTFVTITSQPESHWKVDIFRVDGGNETKLATLAPGDTHSDHVWQGCRIEIREAEEVGS